MTWGEQNTQAQVFRHMDYVVHTAWNGLRPSY
jgi:hypothetical protein